MSICFELCCQQAFAELEALSEPWQEAWEKPDPELAAVTLRLFGAHMVMQSKRLLHAMICERLDCLDAPHQGAKDRFLQP